MYGIWHLAATILQAIVWAALVAWNEAGDYPRWCDALQAVAGEVWLALPAFSITSIAILVAIQKGGRILLTFIDERRQRIRRAQEEARAEGREEGREELRTEIGETLRRDSRMDAIIRDNPEVRDALRELGIDLRDEKNGGG